MRKDVKIGLAVGGILLTILIVYVLKVPSNPKEAELLEPKTAVPEPEIVLNPTTKPTDSIAVAPTTQPLADPFASAPTTAPTAVDTTVATGKGAAKSSDWGNLLETGGKLQSLNAISNTKTEMTSHALGGTPTIHANDRTVSEPGSIVIKPAAKTGARTHVVAKGETLSSIAQAAYGDKTLYTAIVKANPSINPSKLRPGAVLTLPAVESSNATPAAATVDSSKQYKVQPGDTLEKIASRLYGNTNQWEKIYELNKAKIGSDPHKIKSEMVLALPETPSKK
jgi:nucleoid-associated protein YgaU